MVDLSIVENEIKCLEQEDTDYETCEKLAILYIVRDHLRLQQAPEEQPVKSEFLDCVEGVDRDQLMRIMDTHMQAIKIVFPKEYESVIGKIRLLK